MSEWLDYENNPPISENLYFVRRLDRNGDIIYNSSYFEKQIKSKKVFSNEFGKIIDLLIVDEHESFVENNGSFVTHWMEIPECDED